VAGNAPQSVIAGPLSYEGGALTSPGTNVAIDGHGHLHVLYIDSNKHVPMYTSSRDNGATWSNPVDVNLKRAGDTHMWPCLSCTKHGNLLGGSIVYDAAVGKYSVLMHRKPEDEDEWTTREVDGGPWAAAGPSPGFRIGFGDYFDCDCLPECGISLMAWSETANGLQPWQTWARVLDLCQFEQDRVDALEDEIEYLTSALESRELPFPGTQANIVKFEERLAELRAELQTARETLQERRAANPLPED
jgi:hypothetical protein